MSKDVIIFDVETTGFQNSDDITQLAYMRIGSDLKLKETYSAHFKTDQIISPKVVSITGVNNLKLNHLSQGKYFDEVLPQFLHIFQEDNLFVGHNISFDARMLKSNIERHGVELSKMETLCTMRSLTEEMAIPGNKNTFKFPKLGEAFNFCSRKLNKTPAEFNDNFAVLYGKGQAHDALYDTYVTYVCYAYLKATRGRSLHE